MCYNKKFILALNLLTIMMKSKHLNEEISSKQISVLCAVKFSTHST